MRLGRYPAVFFLTLMSAGAIADESLNTFSAPAFRQFEATYNASTMGMTLDLKRSLTKEADVYTLSSRGKNILISMKESAEFRISEGRIEGIRFDSKVKSLKTTKRSVRFNRAAGVIDSMKRGDWTQHQWAPHILDRFSQQQQLRLTLMSSEKPPQTLSFTVVDGPKVSEKRWERAANEVIQTPMGAIDTVKYHAVHSNPSKRASEIWLAPKLDFLMVKTVHVERSSTITVGLRDLSWLDETPSN
ncbi:MAG: DUF3108 domain-containing protein [Luminiphilus sp.]|nr:DUF3108 domain-containing protein [Luminiphilus sp.]